MPRRNSIDSRSMTLTRHVGSDVLLPQRLDEVTTIAAFVVAEGAALGTTEIVHHHCGRVHFLYPVGRGDHLPGTQIGLWKQVPEDDGWRVMLMTQLGDAAGIEVQMIAKGQIDFQPAAGQSPQDVPHVF
ncbi:hypothetical protein JKG47_05600 [Acidithiobacillus sp. MC6.1]|nr:hypothetical protein [Acidithiobacillus sp. MC6.1]